ncbi:hypothetical protein [Aestuariibaculum suncheonense]|uniref:Uncharacterized protein n=1 Tax=Aestuariibaculum suncheonense TaxID=1028745 RepID=A0A8J6UI46_9FLAO|nr:hypothetical protein [Aestuariibaculum suncheonense]MBD0836219.1 hypothetical protein [Aestuariibaculum suncheonense]
MKQILFIENEKDTVLPKEHHKTNNICAIIYDQITEIFTKNKYKTLYETNLSFNENNLKFEEFQNGEMHILDFLKENELNDDIEKILTKHILLSISSDFVNFVFESLSCAKKCKSTVAYALSRKPFTDELFLLEQLLVDRKDFIYKFFHIGEPKNYDPSYKHDKKEIIKETIENCISKLKMNFFHSKDSIYELRYDKSLERGLNGVSNKALHIVTIDKNYKTAEQNLNFIFSKQEDIFEQLNDYYSTIPPLLFYTASVIDEIAFSFTEKSDSENKSRQVLKQFRRLIGYILYAEANKITEIAKSNEVLNFISENLNFICENCNQKTVPTRDDFEYFFYANSINCKSCFSDLLKFNRNIDEICQISN